MDEFNSILGLVMFIMLLIVCGGAVLAAGIVVAALCRMNIGATIGLVALCFSIMFPPLLIVALIFTVFSGIFAPSRKQVGQARAARMRTEGKSLGLSDGLSAAEVRRRQDEMIRYKQLHPQSSYEPPWLKT